MAAASTLGEAVTGGRNLASARVANARFRRGGDSYLNSLDAQRSLDSAQQTLIDLELSRISNLAALYQPLGGGWPEHSAVASVAKTAQ